MCHCIKIKSENYNFDLGKSLCKWDKTILPFSKHFLRIKNTFTKYILICNVFKSRTTDVNTITSVKY